MQQLNTPVTHSLPPTAAQASPIMSHRMLTAEEAMAMWDLLSHTAQPNDSQEVHLSLQSPDGGHVQATLFNKGDYVRGWVIQMEDEPASCL